MSCVAIFTISSFLCGMAPTLGMLILFRVLQGAGGGGLQPSEQAILADTFPPAKRGMAFAVYGMAVVLAPAIGPTLGGWITDNFTWRWIFFINVPVGILSLILTSRLIQDPPFMQRKSFRKRKSITSGSAWWRWAWARCRLCSIKASAKTGSTRISSWCSRSSRRLSLLFLIYWEWTRKDPVIDLHLFNNRDLRGVQSADVHAGLRPSGHHGAAPALHAGLDGLHRRAGRTGAITRRLRLMLLMPLVGFLLSRYDARKLMVYGLVVLSFSLFHMTDFNRELISGRWCSPA